MEPKAGGGKVIWLDAHPIETLLFTPDECQTKKAFKYI